MRGLRVHPARVLANRPLAAAGEVFQRERAGSAQRSQRPEAEPSTAPTLANLAKTFLASSGTATRRGRLPGVCADMPGPL